jgi:hypothetical protein
VNTEQSNNGEDAMEVESPPELSPEDDALLDEIWDRASREAQRNPPPVSILDTDIDLNV